MEVARKQIVFAREYTLSLLADVEDGDWFRMPRPGTTHLAWQVGHLAMAEYMLVLFRLRGKIPEDEDLIAKPFLKRFVKRSTPEPDPAKNLPPAEILATFHRVHERVLAELDAVAEADLSETITEPYVGYNTKLGSLLFCAAHEMMHAGQIGLLRRLLGKPPVR